MNRTWGRPDIYLAYQGMADSSRYPKTSSQDKTLLLGDQLFIVMRYRIAKAIQSHMHTPIAGIHANQQWQGASSSVLARSSFDDQISVSKENLAFHFDLLDFSA